LLHLRILWLFQLLILPIHKDKAELRVFQLVIMTSSNFIPAGRTSLVKRGGSAIQVQTEYAYRPYPRLTTTILDQGQVLHKIERKLDIPIESLEQQSSVEGLIVKQHKEILSILNDNQTFPAPQGAPPLEPAEPLTTRERLATVPGVEHIYSLDNQGHFTGAQHGDHFKQAFTSIFKSIAELMEVFALLPGGQMREKGVYEVQRDRLYLVSRGDECYFVTVHRANHEIVYEKALKEALLAKA